MKPFVKIDVMDSCRALGIHCTIRVKVERQKNNIPVTLIVESGNKDTKPPAIAGMLKVKFLKTIRCCCIVRASAMTILHRCSSYVGG